MADDLALSAFWDFVDHGGDPWEVYSIETYFLGGPLDVTRELEEVGA